MSPEDLGQRLFRAARSERPRSDLEHRILERAEAGPPELARAAPSRARWLVAGSLAAAAALAAGTTLLLKSPPQSHTPAIAAERFVPVAPHEPQVTKRPEPIEVAPTAPTGSSALPEAERSAPAPKSAAPRALPEQLRLLKRARAALRSGQAARSLEVLDEYQRRPNRVDMSAEATLLRIEALASLGQRARAGVLAEEFVKAHPSSPLADRARSFTSDAGEQQGAPPLEGQRPGESTQREEPFVRSEDGERQTPNGRVSDEDHEE